MLQELLEREVVLGEGVGGLAGRRAYLHGWFDAELFELRGELIAAAQHLGRQR